MKLWRICPAAMGLALCLAGGLLGQDRGRMDPRDIIRSADDNNDGWIEQSELGQRSGYYVRRAAERIGLDPNSKLPVDKILPALEAMRNEEGGGSQGNSSSSSSGGNSGSSSSSSRPATPPNAPQSFGAPAAGAPAATAKVPGFDVPLSAGGSGALDKKFDQRVIDYVNDMLRERDVNKNGILEKSEWTGRWSTPPEESDLNKDGVLDREELCVRIAKRFNITSPGSGSTSSSGSSGSPPGPGSFGSGGSNSGGDSNKLRGYADSLIKQYDKSKNGMLEKDEWKEMRSEHQSSDANKDGVITIDELAAHLQGYSGGASPGGNGPGGPGGSPGNSGSSSASSSPPKWGERWGSRGPGGSDKKTAEQPKRSYRFLSPTERLPKGMPDWFLRGDADGDGQVSMVEYAASWSEQVAADFQKYDLNGDGVITPEECQKVDSTKSPKK